MSESIKELYQTTQDWALKNFKDEYQREEFVSFVIEAKLQAPDRCIILKFMKVDFLRKTIADSRTKSFEQKVALNKPQSLQFLKEESGYEPSQHYLNEDHILFEKEDSYTGQMDELKHYIHKASRQDLVQRVLLNGDNLKNAARSSSLSEGRASQIVSKFAKDVKVSIERMEFLEIVGFSREDLQWMKRLV